MMKARDLMTENPECVTEGDTVEHAAQLMRELNVGLIPVVDDASSRRLRGVITDRDIAVRHVAHGHDSRQCRVRDEMSSGELYTVTPDDEDSTIMARMKEGRVRRIPVVENDRVVGIVAQADLAVKSPDSSAEEVERTIERISEPARPER
jgi:CBS domain-containing protein